MSFWTNKVVLITGASSGIGRGLALELARRGARVGLVARRQELLEEIIHEIERHPASEAKQQTQSQLNGLSESAKNQSAESRATAQTQSRMNGPSEAGSKARAIALPADVQDENSMKSAVARLESEFGPVDMLIANAGIGGTWDASELEGHAVAKVINVNVIGVANSVAAVVPRMVARGRGQLVAISSLAAYRGLPKSAAYCASKAAVSAFFESLRLDLEPRGIDVTIIHPGFIKTPLTAGRDAQMPFLMELDDAVKKIVAAIEKRKKSYAFPWQLASIVRAGMVMPIWMYDRISRRNSFRE